MTFRNAVSDSQSETARLTDLVPGCMGHLDRTLLIFINLAAKDGPSQL